MTYRKKFVPQANLRKLLKKQENPRLDDDEQPKPQHEDGSGFLSELRQLDQAVDEAIKSHGPTTS